MLDRARGIFISWLDTGANVRIHGKTHQRPLDRFAEERTLLHPLPAAPFDAGTVRAVHASTTCTRSSP